MIFTLNVTGNTDRTILTYTVNKLLKLPLRYILTVACLVFVNMEYLSLQYYSMGEWDMVKSSVHLYFCPSSCEPDDDESFVCLAPSTVLTPVH